VSTTLTRPAPGVRRAALFAALAVVVMALVAFVMSNASASLAQHSLRNRWDRILASGAEAPARPGDPVAEISIPAAQLDTIVVEGPWNTRRGPVHLARTVAPGSAGVSAIEGSRLGFGGFFAHLDRLQEGDEVDVRTASGIVRFSVVEAKLMDASAIDLSSNGDLPILMLIAPASRLGGGERLVVRARATS
jgi:LPXTG-site transpeptidase (sortase) family protein